MDIRHFMKIDHLTFLLMAPFILFGYRYIAIILWLIALAYDIYEEKIKDIKSE